MSGPPAPKKSKVSEDIEPVDDPMEGSSSELSVASPPTKRKLDFMRNFWKQNRQDEKAVENGSGKESDITIADIVQKGINSNSTLKIRVTGKGNLGSTRSTGTDILRFSGHDGTGEIGFLSFGTKARTLDNLIEKGKIYSITSFEVTDAIQKLTLVPENQLEIKLNQSSTVTEREDVNIPPIKFSFKQLSDVIEMEKYSKIDIIGVIVSMWDLENTNDKIKRTLLISDEKKTLVMVTLWGDEAENFKGSIGSVLAIRKGEINNYCGEPCVNPAKFGGSWIFIDPPVPEVKALQMWFEEAKYDILDSSELF